MGSGGPQIMGYAWSYSHKVSRIVGGICPSSIMHAMLNQKNGLKNVEI